jgi:hypothetical protein
MLREVHALGIPWQGWENIDYMLGYDETFYGAGLDSDDPLAYDPTYVDDFWNAEGYLGTEDSALGERVRAELAEMGDTLGHRWNIAKRFYYRYQVPAASEGWIALDQFRNPDGTPLYPQRPVPAPVFAGAVSGNTAFDGSVNGKVIAVSNLYDTDALPWHTDWYGQRVKASLGKAAADTYRVYFNDHADHQDAPVTGERAKNLVNWYGMVEQALRDLSVWVERGVPAPRSTRYDIEDSQVVVPGNAAVRRGIQPTVDLSVRGGADRVDVAAGQTVTFRAKVQTPPDGGEVVVAEWDFEGTGSYTDVSVGSPKRTAQLRSTYTYDTPGVYYAALRVTAQRDGVPSEFTQLLNLDRVRIVVH